MTRDRLETLPPERLEAATGGLARRVLMKGPKTAEPKTPIVAGVENLEHALNHNWKAGDILSYVQDSVRAADSRKAAILDHAIRYLNGTAAHLRNEKRGLEPLE